MTSLVALVAGLTTTAQVQALPPEYLSNASFHPTDANVLVVRYESAFGGLLITRDGGKSYRAYPSRGFNDYGLTGRVPLLVAGDGKLLLGISDGYFEDDGKGCSIAKAQLDNVGTSWIADIAPHPSDPSVTFIANTGSLSDAKHIGLWKRDKNGALTPLGVSEPAVANTNSVIVRGLKVIPRAASMDGLRFVETLTRQTYMTGQTVPTPSSALRYSDDRGATWTEHAIPDPDKTNGSARLLAVSATEPMKIVVALENNVGADDGPDPVFVSTDGGATFTSYIKDLIAPSQALLLPSGQLLLGDSGSPGGLYLAEAIGMPLSKITEEPVKCLAQRPGDGKLVLCRPYEIGLFDLASKSFCATFQLNETAGLMACTNPDLATSKVVKQQLCDAWCGPSHYSFSPLCAIYDEPGKLCGIQARELDLKDPDPNKRWVEPPGAFAAPRCPGWERPITSGDAGVDAGGPSADAGADAATPDAAAPHDHETGSDPEPHADAGMEEPRAKKDSGGCQLASASAHGPSVGWLALSLMSLLALRRRKR